MENQLMTEFAALKETLREQQAELVSLASLKEMLREQQAELASLRETLAQKQAKRTAKKAVPDTTATPPVRVSVPDRPLPAPDTSRRKMLKRLGLAMLAGG